MSKLIVFILHAVFVCGVALLAMTVAFSPSADAGDYFLPGPTGPIFIGGDDGAGEVGEVPGKEYSHTDWFSVYHSFGDPELDNAEDHDAFATPDPLQIVSWDGLPGPFGPLGLSSGGPNSGSDDAFDFNSDTAFQFPNGQVDALSNHTDFLFKRILSNEATLLFSMTADIDISTVLPPAGSGSSAGIVAKAHVHFEDPDPVTPALDALDVWATIEAAPAGPGPGPGVNHHVVEDLDALEIWGPDPPPHTSAGTSMVDEGYLPSGVATADGDRFSLDVDSASGTSVWAWDIPTKVVSSYIPHSAIVDAVEALFLPAGFTFDPATRDQIDVDGTMVHDPNHVPGSIGGPPGTAIWDAGDELLFTIDPVSGGSVLDPLGAPVGPAPPIDGGEIMHLVNLGPGLFSISFLSHGGHLWDTAFDVKGTFGYFYEDVDALEAVGTVDGFEIPEPSSVALFLLAIMLAGFRLKQRSA